jgi:SAM-dependent methyltransferase/uncharacterized membrane protein YbhN (UPF0104 family)
LSLLPTRESGKAPSRLSRAARLTLLFLAATALVGVVATAYGVLESGAEIGPPSAAMVAAAALAAGATGANLALRFLRWQFLLRRLGIRVATLPSLGAFLGSFAFLPIPLYLGQMVARVRLTPAADAAEGRRIVLATLVERALDAWALLVLSLAFLSGAPLLAAVAVAALSGVPAVRRRAVGMLVLVAGQVAGVLFEPPDAAMAASEGRSERSRDAVHAAAGPVDGELRGGALAAAAVTSLVAWLATAASLAPVAWAAGVELSPLASLGVAASSILAGAASLVPLGAGVSGLFLLRELGTLSTAAAADAAAVVFFYRAATVWLTLGLGAVALVVHHVRSRAPVSHDHFDHIDACYDTWLPTHFRAHVVGRKVAAMQAHLARLAPGARGLDVGCGRGWYLAALGRQGFAMVGLDPSTRQLAAARTAPGASVPLVRGSVSTLPFAPASFDFAYVINVLHHLPSVAQQHRAFADLAALLRPGGRLFVHEMNVVNPLFRFYLGYVFPLVKGIEEGTEHYLDMRSLPAVPGLRLEDVECFTFVPDFAPAGLLPRLARLEARLERGSFRRYAAHFMAVFERV